MMMTSRRLNFECVAKLAVFTLFWNFTILRWRAAAIAASHSYLSSPSDQLEAVFAGHVNRRFTYY